MADMSEQQQERETELLDLNNTEWDCCVVGNGVSALWISHWLWCSKKNVLWITTEEPYNPQRAMLQHGWLWGLPRAQSMVMTDHLQGFETDEVVPEFEAIYYDARSAKRFKKFGEAKQEWGEHEKEYFAELTSLLEQTPVDLWSWHARLHSFHDTGQGQGQGPTQVELFSEPRFVRVQNWPLTELKTENGRLTGAVLVGRGVGRKKTPQPIEIRAAEFYLGDFDEFLPNLIQEQADSEALAAALKGRSFRAGFGLRLWHKDLEAFPAQTAVVPLVANPSDKRALSHVAGRFLHTEKGLESYWVGFLTDDELEDNNEILKKIKQAKRAVDRAIPGFASSISREAVTFEPRMRALDLVKKRKTQALGAVLLSDHSGAQVTADSLAKVFGGESAEASSEGKKKAKRAQSKPPEAEASL